MKDIIKYLYATGNIEIGQGVIVTKRTWKERLFSWPWKPWLKQKAIPINSEDRTQSG